VRDAVGGGVGARRPVVVGGDKAQRPRGECSTTMLLAALMLSLAQHEARNLTNRSNAVRNLTALRPAFVPKLASKPKPLRHRVRRRRPGHVLHDRGPRFPVTTCGTPCASTGAALNLTELVLREDAATRFVAGRPGRRPRNTSQRVRQWAPTCEGYRCSFLGRLHRARVPALLQSMHYRGRSVEVGHLNGGGAFSRRLLSAWTRGTFHTILDTYRCPPGPVEASRRDGGVSTLGDRRCARNATSTEAFTSRLYNTTRTALLREFGSRASLARTQSLDGARTPLKPK
jgi:hypothetical protein